MASLYVGSFFTNSVLKFDATTGAFQSVFATSNQLQGPNGIAFGSDGKLYVASRLTNNVLRFNADGSFDQIFATGNGLMGPAGILFDANGKLLVANWQGTPNTVLRFNAGGSFDKAFATDASLAKPWGLVFGADGRLYVSAKGSGSVSGSVARFNADGSFDKSFIPSVSYSAGITFGPSGDLFLGSDVGAGSSEASNIRRYNGTTGAYKQSFAASGGLYLVQFILFDSSNNLYASSAYSYGGSDSPRSTVLKYDSNGSYIGIFASGGGLDFPTGLAIH